MLGLSLFSYLDGICVENDFPAVLAAHWWTRSQNNYVKQNQRYWQQVIEEYDADVYASLWDEENVYQEGDTVKSFYEAYKPKELEVENQKAFDRSFEYSNPKGCYGRARARGDKGPAAEKDPLSWPFFF